MKLGIYNYVMGTTTQATPPHSACIGVVCRVRKKYS